MQISQESMNYKNPASDSNTSWIIPVRKACIWTHVFDTHITHATHCVCAAHTSSFSSCSSWWVWSRVRATSDTTSFVCLASTSWTPYISASSSAVLLSCAYPLSKSSFLYMHCIFVCLLVYVWACECVHVCVNVSGRKRAYLTLCAYMWACTLA